MTLKNTYAKIGRGEPYAVSADGKDDTATQKSVGQRPNGPGDVVAPAFHRSLSLPYPPSANSLWRAWKGRNIKSAAYRKWLAECASDLATQPVEPIPGPYRMTIIVNRPDRRRRDLSNTIKPLEDALQAAGLIRDDADCQRLLVLWGSLPPAKDARVFIHLHPAKANES